MLAKPAQPMQLNQKLQTNKKAVLNTKLFKTVSINTKVNLFLEPMNINVFFLNIPKIK